MKGQVDTVFKPSPAISDSSIILPLIPGNPSSLPGEDVSVSSLVHYQWYLSVPLPGGSG